MRSHRIIILIAISASASLGLIAPGASASSVLSGYGGPGQGNQAMLGTTLIKGGKGGGSGGSAPRGSAGPEVSSLAEPESTASGGSPQRVGHSESRPNSPQGSTDAAGKGAEPASPGRSRRPSHAAGASTPAEAPAATPSLYPAAERIPAGAPGGGLLGFSGSNLLDILCGLLVLVGVAALCARLVRPAPES